MADAMLKRTQTLVTLELQADSSQDGLAHLVAEDGSTTRNFAKAILVLAAPGREHRPFLPKQRRSRASSKHAALDMNPVGFLTGLPDSDS